MRYPDLEIDLLRAFTTVAETGSFTAAADVVGRSQSAVSQKIIRLEELLGRPLFNRTSRSLVLTSEGERLLSAARRMLEFNDMAVRTLVEPADVERLRIGISEDFVPHHLPALLGKFATLCPDVRLELMTGLSCNLLAAYDEDRLDVVIARRMAAPSAAGSSGASRWSGSPRPATTMKPQSRFRWYCCRRPAPIAASRSGRSIPSGATGASPARPTALSARAPPSPAASG
jgi:DNA-binding transcriptional LysR family regulator